MRVLVLCLGTRGDVEPMLAVAKALQRRGHAVTLCAPDNCARWVRDEHGVAFDALGIDFKELLASRAVREAPSVERAIGIAVSAALPGALAAAAASAARGVDLVFASATFPGGADLAEAHGAALVTAALGPVWATREHPFFMVPLPRALQCLNRATYAIPSMARVMDAALLNRWRRETLGLQRPGPQVLEMGRRTEDGSVAPRMCAISPSVFAQPADWDAQTTMAGFWRLDDPSDWKPDAALSAFLGRASSPVVFIGFGSMTRLEPLALAKIVVPAVRQAGVRAVLGLGWSGSLSEALAGAAQGGGGGGDDVFLLKAAPHSKLFPLMSAVVHHGGAGTTAAGLSAGCPTLICPVGADQPMWGEHVHHRLRCGPAPVALDKLSTAVLAARLRELVGNASFRERAQELAARIAREDGLAVAVRVIEDEARRRGKM